jgi:hypothetical protein
VTVQTAGSITVEVGIEGDRRKIVLSGQVGDQIQVGFRAKDGAPEVKVGTFTSIIKSVADAFGADDTFTTKFDDTLKALAGGDKPGLLAGVVKQLRDAQLIITDMYLQANHVEAAKDGKPGYVLQNCAFGFRVEFSDLPPIGGLLKLVGFGVLFEYTPPPTKGGTSVSRLTSHAQ